jgi:hypothetical protein
MRAEAAQDDEPGPGFRSQPDGGLQVLRGPGGRHDDRVETRAG